MRGNAQVMLNFWGGYLFFEDSRPAFAYNGKLGPDCGDADVGFKFPIRFYILNTMLLENPEHRQRHDR